MEPFRKQEGNKHFLQKLNQETGELEWIEIDLTSLPKTTPTYQYYIEQDYPDYVTHSDYE